MLAPPSHGVARSYYPWEGGDISKEGLGIQLLFKFHFMPVYGYGYPPYSWQQYWSFFHSYPGLPSAKSLLPVYNYVINEESGIIPWDAMEYINTELSDLNSDLQKLLANTRRVVIVAGRGHPTLNQILVRTCSNCGVQWPDGEPHGQSYYADGDGTILLNQAGLPGISSVVLGSDHGGIVRESVPIILSELGLPPLPVPIPVPTPEPPSEVLGFHIGPSASLGVNFQGPVTFSALETPLDMLVTDSSGRQIGYLTDGTFINEIPYAGYVGQDSEPKLILIPDPVQGQYLIQVRAGGSISYTLAVFSQRLDSTITVITDTIGTGETNNHWTGYTRHDTYLPIVIRNSP
jgi:hypothetical protein